jgi:DNA polymerase I-like protein with 3'-5' exonuclease and polymerase domains
MGEDFKGDIALKSMAIRYNLFKDVEELEFLERMKSKRDVLHLEEAGDVMRYVVADTVITWRLFELQKAIIASSNDPNVEPYSIVSGDDVNIEIGTRPVKPRFLSTKQWSSLPELVDWEQRISRWCANQAIRGIRFDKVAVNDHLMRLASQYKESLTGILDMVSERFDSEKLNQLASLIFYQRVLNHVYRYKPKPNLSRSFYSPKPLPRIDNLENYIACDNPEDKPLIAAWLQDKAIWIGDGEYVENPPSIDMVSWVHDNFFDGEEFDNTINRIRIIIKWFEHYFTRTVPIDPLKLANMKLFQPYFVFIVCNKDFPSNPEIVQNSNLVTDKLRMMVERGVDMDYQYEAITTYGWSFGDNAIHHYFKDDNPFVTLLSHRAKMNRIDEFLRHSERDGRIHSVIARKTRTGRAASTTMNLQNLQMKTFKGYLIPDDDNRMLISIDISNAENWLLAMIFADSQLALACASGDLHGQMTRTYWPELSQQLIDSGDWDAFKELRKKSKFVTFGSAYGAGAKKISRMIGTSQEEAQTLLNNRDNRYIGYSTGRHKLTQRIEKCYRDGHRPAFTALWSGRRIAIPMREVKRRSMSNGKIVEQTRIELAAYKATNYLPQGGVGEIIWRAIVLASEKFERENWGVNVCLQVHDEIVIDTPIDKAFEVASVVIEILANMIPQEFLNRTVPACRILAQFGPENLKKWGFQYGKKYPLPVDKFVNRWGIFDMPEDEFESPTWIGDLSNGYSLEAEIEASVTPTVEENSESEVQLLNSSNWGEFVSLLQEINGLTNLLNQSQNVSRLIIDGEDHGLYDFSNRMLIQQELAHKGHKSGDNYWEVLNQIDKLQESLFKLRKWKMDMGMQ